MFTTHYGGMCRRNMERQGELRNAMWTRRRLGRAVKPFAMLRSDEVLKLRQTRWTVIEDVKSWTEERLGLSLLLHCRSEVGEPCECNEEPVGAGRSC